MGDIYTMMLYGHTKIWKNDELILDKKNAITNTLREYLKNRMDSAQDTEAVDGNNNSTRFTTGDLAGNDAGIQSRHGIIVGPGKVAFTPEDPNTYRSMVTTNIDDEASNTNGRKWRGFLTAGGPRTFRGASLVFEWDWNSGNPLGVSSDTKRYAVQTFQQVTLAQNDTLTIEWEVFVA